LASHFNLVGIGKIYWQKTVFSYLVKDLNPTVGKNNKTFFIPIPTSDEMFGCAGNKMFRVSRKVII
jgi:hypothetical protein